MPITSPTGKQIRDASIQRDDLDSITVGQSVTRKIVQGAGIVLNSTGADSGTGDVTVNAVVSDLVMSGMPASDIVVDNAGNYITSL